VPRSQGPMTALAVLASIGVLGSAALLLSAGRDYAVQVRGVTRRLPTDAQARDTLMLRYADARSAADAEAYCQASKFPSICHTHYNAAGGRAAVPTTPPTVRESEIVGTERVLTVCGVNGAGQLYRSQFPVAWIDGRPAWTLDVFWKRAASTAAPATYAC